MIDTRQSLAACSAEDTNLYKRLLLFSSIIKRGSCVLYAIPFQRYLSWIHELTYAFEVYGPVHDRVTSYEKITDTTRLAHEKLTEFPAKEIFFKPGEVILRFTKGELTGPEFLHEQSKKKILLGLRLCDLAAVRKQDIAFTRETKDPYYAKRREDTLLFGYLQKDCGDQYCFCQSIDLKYSFDLMFYKRQDHFLVEAGSPDGEEIINLFGSFFEETNYELTDEDKRIDNQLSLSSHEINGIYAEEAWKELADDCLSCGQCNVVCPTCYCFEFTDTIKEDACEKTRDHSQCQLDCFTRVAGDHVFRDEVVDKLKHRIYHQLQYFKEKHGETLCVGCGRCIRHCPTRIDFVSKINELRKVHP